MDKTPDKLLFGIMVHGMVLSRWQHKCIELLNESGIAKPVLIINDAGANEVKASFNEKLKKYSGKQAIYNLYNRFLFRIPALDHIMVNDVVQDVDVLNCRTLKKGKYSEYFSSKDIEKIESYNLDFILRFGFNIIRGGILEVPKYGVWSYHHGNELEFRGGPAGFWEIFRNSKTNGVVLQKLNYLIDAGVIINRRSFRTVLHSYPEHLNKLLMHGADMPLQVCKQIIDGDDSTFQQSHSLSKAPMNRLPNNRQMTMFLFILFFNRVNYHVQRLFKQEHWDIGIIYGTENKLPLSLNMDNVDWLGLRNGSQYAADSFCFETNRAKYIVFEDYDYETAKGKISLLKIGFYGRPPNIKPVIEKPFHLAYPFVFKHGENIYLIPETAENGTIELYKWNDANEGFDFQQVLLNVAGVDSSIVYHQGRWWLFCGLKNDLPNEKLHVFYADELTGPYKAHLLNPVKTDPAGSRPAGQFIVENGVLFRPAQHSVNWYGEKIDWFKVNVLTPSSFCEEYVGEIVPRKSWDHNKGIHTFSRTSNFSLIDAKKMSSGRHAFLAALKNSSK